MIGCGQCVAGERKRQVVADQINDVSTLLLHFADVRRDWRVEVDGVVPEALRRLVALPTAALERLAHPDLGSVAVLRVVFDTIHILQEKGKHDE